MPASNTSDDPLAVFCLASAGPVVIDDLRVEIRFDGRALHDLSGAVSGVAVPAKIHIAAARRKRVEDRLEHQSRHDDLTGLPNRVLLMGRLARAVQNIPSPPATLLLDLDRFQVVNDTLGHYFGDLLLEHQHRDWTPWRRGRTNHPNSTIQHKLNKYILSDMARHVSVGSPDPI